MDPGKFVLASIGRLQRVKGHDIALKVATALPQTHLIIAGSGSNRPHLEAMADSLGISDRVTFLGWYREMGTVFGAADTILFPTRREPFGNVIIEAWREKVPIVTTNLEGPAWLVTDGVHGLLSEKDHVEGYTEAVSRLIADAELRARLIAAGHAKLLQEFSTDAIVSAYLKAFADELK